MNKRTRIFVLWKRKRLWQRWVNNDSGRGIDSPRYTGLRVWVLNRTDGLLTWKAMMLANPAEYSRLGYEIDHPKSVDVDEVMESLDRIAETPPGERLFQPDIGQPIEELLFDEQSTGTDLGTPVEHRRPKCPTCGGYAFARRDDYTRERVYFTCREGHEWFISLMDVVKA